MSAKIVTNRDAQPKQADTAGAASTELPMRVQEGFPLPGMDLGVSIKFVLNLGAK